VKTLLKRLLSALSLVGAMLLVSEAILAGVLFGAGVVTAQKAADIVKVIQGRLTSPPEVEIAEKAPVEIGSEQELKNAVREWLDEKQVQESRIRAETEAVQSVKRELEQERATIDRRWRELEVRETAFEQARNAQIAAERDAGFRAAVERYEKMDARDVAQMLYTLTDEDILKYLRVFKSSVGAEILVEIKKIDEKAGPAAKAGAGANRAARLQEILAGGWTAPADEAAAVAATQ
jgi:flagellar motility protein MotE (MotC chaperone)